MGKSLLPREENPEAEARAIIDAALAPWLPKASRLAVTDAIVTNLQRAGVLPAAFEWGVRSGRAGVAMSERAAIEAYAQPGETIERRTAAGAWKRIS